MKIHILFLIDRLACKCADLANKQDYNYFGLQFWGECWSGLENPSYSRDGRSPSGQCLNGDFKVCDDNDERECIGRAFTNYIYQIGKYNKV